MILKIDDWEFDVDMERTMAYSAAEAAEHCDCAYCRNFYAAVDDTVPALRPLLAQFGLNIEALYVLYPYDVESWMWYTGEYVVFGRILQFGKERIRAQNACSPYIWPMNIAKYSFDSPYFVLCLEELGIPWVLDEPMTDVVSPANEPSFLKKMWDNLLGRTKSNGTVS